MIVGIGNTSFKSEDKVICGFFLFIVNSEITRAAPIFWKLKQKERVCHSSKDAKTMNLSRMVDDTTYAARQLELLLYEEYNKRIKVRLFTDSESTLETIALSKHIDRKSLRMTMVDLKGRLVEGYVYSYVWLPMQHMWADVLTKEV